MDFTASCALSLSHPVPADMEADVAVEQAADAAAALAACPAVTLGAGTSASLDTVVAGAFPFPSGAAAADAIFSTGHLPIGADLSESSAAETVAASSTHTTVPHTSTSVAAAAVARARLDF